MVLATALFCHMQQLLAQLLCIACLCMGYGHDQGRREGVARRIGKRALLNKTQWSTTMTW